jgi:superkiller protein 3
LTSLLTAPDIENRAFSRWTLSVLIVLVLGHPIFPDPLAQVATARELAQKGAEYAGTGDFKSAERALRQAAGLAPGDPRILATLGSILGMEHKLEEAGSYLKKALKLDPGDTVTRRNLGANEWQLGHLHKARGNLEIVLKENPLDRQATLLLGMVAENLGEYATAARLLQSVAELVERQPTSMAALASALYHTEQADAARAVLQSMLEAHADAQSIFTGARVAADAQDYPVAEAMFSSIRSSYPDTGTLSRNIALAQYHAGRFAACQSTLTEPAIQARITSDGYNLLGWCFEKTGNLREAVAALQNAIETEPSKESNYLDLCTILSAGNRLALALEVANRAVQLLPPSYPVLAMKGSIESRLQHFSDAVESYRKAAQLKPNEAGPQCSLAIALWSAGMVSESTRIFDGLIRRFPNDGANYEAFGVLLVNDSSASDAEVRGKSLLEKALELDQYLKEARFQLGNLALMHGETEKALRYFEAVVKLDPKSSKLHFALSRALKRMGRTQEAASELALFEKLKTSERPLRSDRADLRAPQ